MLLWPPLSMNFDCGGTADQKGGGGGKKVFGVDSEHGTVKHRED